MAKKLLWLSNFCFSEDSSKSSGTWIEAMGKALLDSGLFELANITVGKVPKITGSDYRQMRQWIVPLSSLDRMGCPNKKTIAELQMIADEVSPDLIHVWGSERFWGLLTARQILPYPALLEMQGIKYAMAPYMSGGLTACEQLRCLGLKELLRPESAVLRGGDLFSASRHMELEIIKGHRYITYQSEWVKAYLMPYCGNATLMPSKMMLRKAFLDADAWRFDPERELTVFCSTSLNAAPNKGLYTLLKALKFLRLKGVTVKCVLAGTPPQRGIRRSGYTRFLQREIERSGIGDFIVLAGSMGERELVRAIQVASVVVVPSFVESYSMTLAEAMAVGVPVVTTYAGAMPELAKDGESALFFPAGDCGACAMQLDRVLSSPELAVRLGAAARVSSLARHAPESVLRRQIENYQTVWDALSVSGSGTKEKA